MDSGNESQDATTTPPSTATAPEGKITFARFAHEMKSRHEGPLAEALRVTLGVKRADVETATFTRSELNAKLEALLGSN